MKNFAIWYYDENAVQYCGNYGRAVHVAAVARRDGINRVTVYKTLKPGTESSFTTMLALLKASNVSLQVLPTEPRRPIWLG